MKTNLVVLCCLVLLYSCDGTDGLFGHSKSKEEAKANGGTVLEYVPNKKIFKLLDGTKMQIDTAWAEVSFTFKDGRNILDSTYGYNFAIPYKREDPESFSFNFGLADTTNRMFTNGREANVCQLHPIHLFDEIKVILNRWLQDQLSQTKEITVGNKEQVNINGSLLQLENWLTNSTQEAGNKSLH
ncbi:MAG: hypothetical protein EOO07_09045, partial [Chitinophagaceae bacterium]